MLTLDRPLVFFDLETTGVDVFNDRILQIGAIKLSPDGSEEEFNQLFNPGIPIPEESSAVHGITNDMVQDKPRLGDMASDLAALFLGADLSGYNIKHFDIPFLAQEFQRIGLTLDTETTRILDAMAIFRIKEPRTLAAAYTKYCGKELVDAHDAMVDIRASRDVLYGQLTLYNDIPRSAEGIHEFCFPKDPDAYDAEGKLRFVNGELTINFGKNKGKSLHILAQTDPGYLEWMMNGTFSNKVKEAIKTVLR